MCFLALFNAYAMRACLSITITEMVKKPVEDSVKDTGTCTNLMVSTSSEIMSRSAILSNETSKPENFTIHHELHGERYDWDEYKQVNWFFFLYRIIYQCQKDLCRLLYQLLIIFLIQQIFVV